LAHALLKIFFNFFPFGGGTLILNPQVYNNESDDALELGKRMRSFYEQNISVV
jgi:hypothetical protein